MFKNRFLLFLLALGMVFTLSSFSENNAQRDCPREGTEVLISADDGWIDLGQIKIHPMFNHLPTLTVTLYARELGNRIIYRIKYGESFYAVQVNPTWLDNNKSWNKYKYMATVKVSYYLYDSYKTEEGRYYFDID